MIGLFGDLYSTLGTTNFSFVFVYTQINHQN